MWAGILGIEGATPSISRFASTKFDQPNVIEKFSIWDAHAMLAYRAIDRPTFQNGFGLHIPQFSSRWNRQNVSTQIIVTGNKIKTYLIDNCLSISKKIAPNLIVNVSSTPSMHSASLLSKFREIKCIGSPFCSMESDGWLSNTNREYTGININFLGAGVKLHTLTVRLFTMDGKIKEAHAEFLRSTALKYGFSKMLFSITIDNCSAILGAGDKLKGDINFPAFEGHVGCLAHQISLISNSVITEFSKSFKPIPDSELEEMLTHEKRDYKIPSGEYETLVSPAMKILLLTTTPVNRMHTFLVA